MYRKIEISYTYFAIGFYIQLYKRKSFVYWYVYFCSLIIRCKLSKLNYTSEDKDGKYPKWQKIFILFDFEKYILLT